MRPPWWCCFGWSPRSLACLADNTAHAALGLRRSADSLPWLLRLICDAHDRLITRDLEAR